MVEQLAVNQRVIGSIPIYPSTLAERVLPDVNCQFAVSVATLQDLYSAVNELVELRAFEAL